MDQDRVNAPGNWSSNFTPWLDSIGCTLVVLILKQRPRVIINSREDHAMAQQLLARFQHVRDLQSRICCNVLHVQTLVALGRTFERMIYLSRVGAYSPYSGVVG